jgi:hypothetical protein
MFDQGRQQAMSRALRHRDTFCDIAKFEPADSASKALDDMQTTADCGDGHGVAFPCCLFLLGNLSAFWNAILKLSSAFALD